MAHLNLRYYHRPILAQVGCCNAKKQGVEYAFGKEASGVLAGCGRGAESADCSFIFVRVFVIENRTIELSGDP